MTEQKLLITALTLLFLFSGSAVLASQHELEQKKDYTSLPALQTYQGIPYVSGGLGIGEREQLRDVMESCNLKLIFALASGAFLADTQVKIKDQQGKVILDVTSEGPWLYVCLPAGSYMITAANDQAFKEKNISLEAAKRQEVRFLW